MPKETAQGNAKSHLSILPTRLSAGGEGVKMKEVENGMLRPIPPCRGETATFREYLIANFSFYDLIGDPMVFEVLIGRYFDDYGKWLKEID